jgi:protease PrsW
MNINSSSQTVSITDSITRNLGLARIEAFTFKGFFSKVFNKHNSDEIEEIFTVGTPHTTPKLDMSMATFPTPWVFGRVLLGIIVTYSLFWLGINIFGNLKLLPGLILSGSFAVPIAVLILFFEMNTPRNVSITRITEFFVLGGVVAILVSLIFFSTTALTDIFGAPAAGLIEENGKLIAIILGIDMLPKDRPRYRLNYLLYGAAVGAGFASFESAGYALELGTKGFDMLSVINMRALLAPFGHVVWSAIAAYAFYDARSEYKDVSATLRSSKFNKLFLVPIALHFIWDMSFNLPFALKYLGLGFVAWVVIISLVQSGIKEIQTKVQYTEPPLLNTH